MLPFQSVPSEGFLSLQLDAVSRYIEGGGSLAATGRHGNTLLHGAAATGNLELLLYLVEKGEYIPLTRESFYSILRHVPGSSYHISINTLK